MSQVPEDLKGLYLEALLTGSRVMCNPPVLATDLDVVLLVERSGDVIRTIEDLGYTLTADTTYGATLDEFVTFRKGDVNLIVTCDVEGFRRWGLATRWCTEMNLQSKADRAAFFTLVRYAPEHPKDVPPFELPHAGVQPWAAS